MTSEGQPEKPEAVMKQREYFYRRVGDFELGTPDPIYNLGPLIN